MIGLAIGFYGYLLPGNINLLMVELYTSKRYKTIFYIFLLLICFEIVYSLSTLILLSGITNSDLTFKFAQIISYFLILIVGLFMLFENQSNKKKVAKNRLYRGIFSIIIHPQQIPFWVVIGILLNPLKDNNYVHFGVFLLMNIIGILLAMLLYMLVGKKLVDYFKLNMLHINKVVGFIYVISSIYSIVKF